MMFFPPIEPPVGFKKIPSLFEWASENREKVLEKVAHAAIRDTCLSVALCALTSFFVTTKMDMVILAILPVAMTTINLFCRTLHLYFQEFNIGMEELLKYPPALTFSMLDLTTRQVMIHEWGHFQAVKLLYQGVEPTITIYPLIGGVTEWFSTRKLTDLGKQLGQEHVKTAVAMAGVAATQLINIPTLIAGHYMRGELGLYLQATAFMSALCDATNAVLAWNPKSGSDFVRLNRLGIHPFLSAFTVLLIPVIVKSALLYLDQMREEKPS